MTAQRKHELQRRYWHATGVVRWIGAHAAVTQYHPEPARKARWQAAVRFWNRVRRDAWAQLHPRPHTSWLVGAFLCIHRYEGAWNANTGNGYFGGLQMDMAFQSRYGAEYLRRWGTADRWPVWAQINASVRAYQSGRGFYPWPNTARMCGLL
jgi:hypothetical protein